MAGEAEVTNETEKEQTGGAEKTGSAAETILNVGSAADSGAGGEKAKTSDGGENKGDWPADWRDKMAGGDEKFRKQLDRYGSPLDLAKKGRELEAKFSSGEYKRDLPKNATEEAVAEWRKERGLPEDADAYISDLSLPDGVVLGEADKPIALGFAEAAHKANLTKEQYSGLVAQYYAMQDKVKADRAEDDARYHQESILELKEEWGPEYKPNVTAVNNLLAGWPNDIANQLLSARDPDTGRQMGDNPKFIRQMSLLARELNPAATLVPANGSSGKGIEEQLAEISKLRREDPDKYDADKEMQALELKLIDAKSKLAARGKAA